MSSDTECVNLGREGERMAALDEITNSEWERLLALSDPPSYALESPVFRREWERRHGREQER